MRSPQQVLATILIFAAASSIACRREPAIVQQTTQPKAERSSPMAETAPYDIRFIDTMSKHHRGAVEMAAIVQMKLEHAGLKELARVIPVDQQKEIDQMKSWRDQWYPGAPVDVDTAFPGMGSGMNMDMSHMKTMEPGQGYDVMFIDMMVPHHESAIAMSRAALASAEHQELKMLAQQIIDTQTKEIGQMKEWRVSLAGSGAAH